MRYCPSSPINELDTFARHRAALLDEHDAQVAHPHKRCFLLETDALLDGFRIGFSLLLSGTALSLLELLERDAPPLLLLGRALSVLELLDKHASA